MAKQLWTYVKQIVALIAAVGLAVLVTIYGRSALPAAYQGKDELEFAKIVIPFMTPVIYLLGALSMAILARLIPPLRRWLDPKAAFAGTYLSLPSNPDQL